jgi:hypothetical protein
MQAIGIKRLLFCLHGQVIDIVYLSFTIFLVRIELGQEIRLQSLYSLKINIIN